MKNSSMKSNMKIENCGQLDASAVNVTMGNKASIVNGINGGLEANMANNSLKYTFPR